MITITDSIRPFMRGKEEADLRITQLSLSAARLATVRGYVDGCFFEHPHQLIGPPIRSFQVGKLRRGLLFLHGNFYSVLAELSAYVEREYRQPVLTGPR